jgi:hypothetical protein
VRGDIAERDCPAVALAAAGSSPVGLASGSEAPPTSRGLRAPRDYPRYGFNDIKLGSIWKQRPVEMYLTMEWEAAQRRESASQSSDEKFCQRCRCYSLFEGMTDECCLTKRGEHCNMIGETSRSKKKVRAKPKKPMGGGHICGYATPSCIRRRPTRTEPRARPHRRAGLSSGCFRRSRQQPGGVGIWV